MAAIMVPAAPVEVLVSISNYIQENPVTKSLQISLKFD